jgi:hypothetical protein
MKTPIKLSNTFGLPLDFVTQTCAIIAKRRVGKSYLMRRCAEQLQRASQQIVIVDPKGDQWGIRYGADGKSPGLPILIFGGERADVPLEVSGGELVAKLVVEERVSALLDLSLFRKHEVATFMTAFLETLYRLKAREAFRTPVMLIVDEADAIAPQQPQPNEARMLGAIEDIVRRGGQRGVGCMLITQRTAVLNKNVLTQAQILIALRTIAPQDLKAMRAWIDVHGDADQRDRLMTSLPSLEVGTAWVWSPGWPTSSGIFEVVKVGPISTFDSGATPKPGEKRIEPKKPADVDVEAVKRQMAETIERAKQDDPKALRAELAAVKKQLAAKMISEVAVPAAPAKVKEVPALKAADRKALEAVAARLEKAELAVSVALEDFRNEFRSIEEKISDASKGAREVASNLRAALAGPATVSSHSAARPFGALPQRGALDGARAAGTKHDGSRERPALQPRPRSTNGHAGPAADLPKGELAVIKVAAMYGDEGATREQITLMSGYKRSTRDAYIQRAREKAMLDQRGDRLVATDAGVQALGSEYEPLPTGDELRAYWLQRLPEGERKVLDTVCGSHPVPVPREMISDSTGYKRSTRDAYIQRLATRLVINVNRDGTIGAKPELFS